MPITGAAEPSLTQYFLTSFSVTKEGGGRLKWVREIVVIVVVVIVPKVHRHVATHSRMPYWHSRIIIIRTLAGLLGGLRRRAIIEP